MKIHTLPNLALGSLAAGLLALAGLEAGGPPAMPQVTFRTIYTLGGVSQPGGLHEAEPGLFYSSGGSYNFFSINTKGAARQLAPPPNANNFGGPPLPAANGRAYSGVGTGNTSAPFSVVSITSQPGSMVTYPATGLNPALYQPLPNGTILAQASNVANGIISVATVDLGGNVTPVWQLPSWTDRIYSDVLYASDGNYYGVSLTAFGGPPNEGSSYVFQVTPSGAMNNLLTLPNNVFNSATEGWIIQGSDGNLYMETPFGGATGNGALYQITLTGQSKIIYSYVKGPSAYPSAFIQASDGNFYGTTHGSGSNGVAEIYRLTLTGQYTSLHTMNGPDGQCGCTLIQGGDGVIYGTSDGGGSNGAGTVWALNAGLPKPAPQALSFQPTSGPPGTKVQIWGYNLLAASAQFNGVAASAAHSSGPNYVIATVSKGATSGPITITTPGGTSTTAASFTVN
jgi:hypothetical protein